jgi:hypothetical protein
LSVSFFIDGVPRDWKNYFRDSPMKDIFENTVLSAGTWMAREKLNYFFIILISIINPKPRHRFTTKTSTNWMPMGKS